MREISVKYIVIIAIFAQFLCNNSWYYGEAPQHANAHESSESSQADTHDCPVNKAYVKDSGTALGQMAYSTPVPWAACTLPQYTISNNIPVELPNRPPPFLIPSSYGRQFSTVRLM